MEKVKTTSEDLKIENLDKLKEIFPNVFNEGKLDIEKLKNFLGDNTIDEKTIEKYSLNWAGKSNAFKAIRVPSTGTLVRDNKGVDEENTENIFIEGDNLEVLKLLQKHYFNKIKMIYIDPPYNTGKDFVYKDNWTQDIESYYKMTGQTEDGVRMTANTEKNGRFHSDWLTMMYPRLFLARNLLKDDGVIFVSIDDNEVANLRLIMDEIFGEDNFVASFIWQKNFAPKNDNKYISISTEYILCYGKNIINFNRNLLPRLDRHNLGYSNPDNDIRGDWTSGSILATTFSESGVFEIFAPNGRKHLPPLGRCWRYSKNKIQELSQDNRLWFGANGNGVPRIKRFLNEMPDGIVPQNLLKFEEVGSGQDATRLLNSIFDSQIFDFPKPINLIKRFLQISTQENDIILDFFSGSGTTAHAVMDLNVEDGGNRKWICVQLPELIEKESEGYKAGYKTISEISRERIRRAGKKIKEAENKDAVDLGFKSFSLRNSNYRKWNSLTNQNTLGDVLKQVNLFTEKPLVDNYCESEVVYEILLKEGYNLNSEVKKDNNVYIVTEKVEEGERKIFISFAKNILKEGVEKLKLTENDLFVCFDSALDDTTKVNVAREVNLKVI